MFNTSRRQLIRYGGGFLGTGLAATVLGSQLSQTNAQTAVNSEPWLTMLMEGNQRFWERRQKSPNRDQARLTEVAESQAPFAAILGCADSRVPAEIVFDRGLGDLFVCRVAGNLATSEEIGSLEFGTLVLGAKVIVVLGHSRCGAVKATIEGGRFPGQIGRLIDGLQVGVDRAEKQPGSNKLERAIKSNVIYQVEKLGKSPVMGDLVDKKQLKIVGAYYDLDSGKVSLI
ncbi:MAG: carbonic anhydrase [Microcystis aeruginosa Ma_AC_P_19900807_S299]|nr:MAG: carbonic anhydrase [Microcystis aeruginosa Ma_AC_P_19900807_S299]